MMRRIGSFLLLPALLVAPRLATTAIAQHDSVTVIPNRRYHASSFEEVFLGKYYRRLWTTPIRLPTLDLDTVAGGLVPTERGGGLQTHSLHLRSASGREYVFRSVDKYPSLAEEPALQGTPVGWLVQDQTSALNPAGALAVPTLLDAVDIPHPVPRLAVMPDDPALGEFRQEFAGMLGLFEERPDEIEGPEEDRPGFGGFEKIIGTDRLLERIDEDYKQRVDARDYLTARLIDLLIGDWDRHSDQWRWTSEERGDTTYWTPIPRDRDYAFVDYDGLVMRIGRIFVPNAVKFEPRINEVYGLTLNARDLDRRFLTTLDRAVWDSVTSFVQGRITDDVIDRAMRAMPAEYRESNERIARRLKLRRNDLPHAVSAFYSLLSSEVDIEATDKRDIAIIDRAGDGVVDVRLFDANEENQPHGDPYFERRFLKGETDEVRVYLHGGGDHALVEGDVDNSLKVRIIGGDGDDVLVDSSRVHGKGSRAAFYDSEGDNQFITGPRTSVSTRPFITPEQGRTLTGEVGRDWGHLVGLQPVLDYHGSDGVILGAGLLYTRFGFHRFPYKYKFAVRGKVGLTSGAIQVEALGDMRRENSRDGFSFLLSASQLESLHFYGFGNETEAERPSDDYTVRQDQLLAQAAYHIDLPAAVVLSAGPIIEYTRSQLPPGTPFELEHRYGRDFLQAGAVTEVVFDRRDDIAFPSRGVRAYAGGSIFPDVLSTSGTFGEAHASGSAYWTPDVFSNPTLALRLGAKQVWGEFPIHEAAFLGGSRTIRGYGYQRFAGDGMVFGNAELRVPISTVKLLVRGELGVLGLVDAGRVFFADESSSDWHDATGGGLWFHFRVRTTPVAASVVYAKGEEGSIYLKLGAPF